jgi:hypothetical protein
MSGARDRRGFEIVTEAMETRSWCRVIGPLPIPHVTMTALSSVGFVPAANNRPHLGASAGTPLRFETGSSAKK